MLDFMELALLFIQSLVNMIPNSPFMFLIGLAIVLIIMREIFGIFERR